MDNISVTSWLDNSGMTARGGDYRAGADLSQSAFLAWLNFAKQIPDKKNVEFLRYLHSSGIGERAGINYELVPLLEKLK